MIDLSHLKRVAGEATGGTWIQNGAEVNCSKHENTIRVYGMALNQKLSKNAAFIAAFNPEVAKQLIEALECAVLALERTQEFCRNCMDDYPVLEAPKDIVSPAFARISALIGKGEGAE